MKKQQGMATLLITSVLLLVALLFSLASYKNLFYQIKRSQNEVLARQAYWSAEGGLECIFSELYLDREMLYNSEYSDNSKCKLHDRIISLSKVDNDYNISVFDENGSAEAKVSKIISGGSIPSSGTIKATSDMIIESGNSHSSASTIYPDPGMNGINGYQCVLFRYTSNIEIKGFLVNEGLSKDYPPYEGFYNNFNKDPVCDEKYKSSVSDSKIIVSENEHTKPEVFGDDYIYESEFDPFEEFFDEKRENWKIVRNKASHLYVSSYSSCSDRIIDSVKNKKDFIWVEGNCGLTTSDTSNIKESIRESKLNGIILVVQDGILGVDGSVELPALIYHFKSPDGEIKPTKELWGGDFMNENGLSVSFPIFPGGQGLSNEEKEKVVYSQFGSVYAKGGYIFDVPNYTAKLNGSLNFSFNRDVFTDALNKIKRIEWKEGSWRDF